MNYSLKRCIARVLVICIALEISACAGGDRNEAQAQSPNGGRLIMSGAYEVETKIDESDGDPRFRVWITRHAKPIAPAGVRAQILTTRLGGAQQRFILRPDAVSFVSVDLVPEPHSFDVRVSAQVDDQAVTGEFASYEMRTQFDAAVAAASGVQASIAGPAVIRETLAVYGSITADPQQVREVRARFPGVALDVKVKLGDRVKRGQPLATIESNESLQSYSLVSPIDGQIIVRQINNGEAVADGVLLTVGDLSRVSADIAVFRRDLPRVHVGQSVSVLGDDGALAAHGRITYLTPMGSSASQSLTARVPLANSEGRWAPGLFVKGEIVVGERPVPLAVRTSAIQRLRDQPVVFEQAGDVFEARFVKLGAADRDMTEVLAGIAPGARYVTEQSYLIKADIEKAGAEHSH